MGQWDDDQRDDDYTANYGGRIPQGRDGSRSLASP